MSDHNELFQLILGRTTTKAVDRIIAAGYRKPRTIRTHQERAALKPGAICMDLAGNAWKRGVSSWVGTGEGRPLYDEEDLLMVVFYEPTAKEQA